MRKERIAVLVILAAWLLTPDVLCLVPGAQLTASEAECCKRMAGDCERTEMPESHSCCKTLARPDGVTLGKSLDLKVAQQAAAFDSPTSTEFVYSETHTWQQLAINHSPPELIFVSTTVLRI